MMYHSGLTIKEVNERQSKYGKNIISNRQKGKLIKYILHILAEPIYLLLSCSAIIYILLGEKTDGAIMVAFVIFVMGIDIVQDARTGNALKRLKEITTPKIRVIREGKETLLPGEDLVPGDLLLLFEGVKIPADCYLLSSEGLCIDESVLTGESAGVWKNTGDHCFTGTFVVLGSGRAVVEQIGDSTEYGKIATKIKQAPMENSLLQRQMKVLAKQCTLFAAVLFVLVSLITFLNLSDYVLKERIIHSMLAGVVLALSMIPGEFPVILSVFLSMGALRLSKKNALVRRLSAVETLGAVSALCMDKTGTITQNRMQVAKCFVADRKEGRFCRILALSCKVGTLDPVERALLEYGKELCSECSPQTEEIAACNLTKQKRELIKEYAFTNELKAMGQVWREKERYTIAAKGSPETILSLCDLNVDKKNVVNQKLEEYSKSGLRVIAVADRLCSDIDEIPECLSECHLHFRGMIGLLDPPRESISDNIQVCYEAGIRVLMITGDHPITAASIAESVGMTNCSRLLTGDDIEVLSDEKLREMVKECNIYARVLPLHKMRIVEALKANGEIVAMTGDGVNDSPAQKIADIGIAMGKHGSEICRETADLILLDDNLSTIINTVKDGRRIYQNIVKTIGYIFAIHIPIALISLVAPLLGIAPESLLLLPLHIVLMEMVMDPTCSVALERQPPEDDIMKKAPRSPNYPLCSSKLVKKSISQGLIIFLASFSVYYYFLTQNDSAELARTSGFAVLVLSNMLLVFVNCSETEALWHTLKKVGKDIGIWMINIIILFGLLLMIYSPLNHSLGFCALPIPYMILISSITLIAVLWYELIKLRKRAIKKRQY